MPARTVLRGHAASGVASTGAWTGSVAGSFDWSGVASKGLNVPTYKRAAFEALVDMIVDFELPPGERLVESELATRLNVSKTPVREALAMLEAQGLVETAPYKGARVRWLRRVEMEEQGFLVDALEEPAYPLVIARITPIELAAVGQIVDQLKRARSRKDGHSFGRLTMELHRQIFRTTGYPRLDKLVSMVVGPAALRYDRLFVYQFDDAWDTQVSLMEGRYQALRDGDADRAVQVVRTHRAELQRLNATRLSNPEIARHFED